MGSDHSSRPISRRRPRSLGVGVALAVALAVGCTGGAPAAAGHADGAMRAGNTRLVLPRPAAIRLASGVTAIGLASDQTTGGYWVLKSNGGVVSFGARWHGSLFGRVRANTQVREIAAGHAGGYLVLTSDGGVHAFGTPWHGSDLGRLPPGVTAVGLASDAATGGYWIARSDGRVDSFFAPGHGSLRRLPAGSIVTGVVAGSPGGYLVLVATSPVPASLRGRQWDVLPTSRKIVALTFDIGPTNGVPSILATLHRDHVRATFNLVGSTVKDKPTIVRAIAAAGQVLGDHSMTHPHFTKINDAEVRAQVRDAETEIASVAGKDPWPWFRFPFGDQDSHAISLVNSVGFVPIGWTVDTLGWEGTSHGITPQIVVDRVLANRRPGEIVLMHGGSDTGDHSAVDAAALPTVIRDLRADGYSFVTVNTLRAPGTFAHASGQVIAFGTPSYGSDANNLRAGVTAVGLAADPATGGYWILRSDGAVDGFHAPGHGSLAGRIPPGSSVVAIAADNAGYLILTSNGRVYPFG